MKSLDRDIDRLRAELRYIPTLFLKGEWTLRFLREQTQADSAGIHLHDDLGRFTGGGIYPINGKILGLMARLGPAFHTLQFCCDVFERYWDNNPGKAFKGTSENLQLSYFMLMMRLVSGLI